MTRNKSLLRDVIATWRENIRKFKLGKRFMTRAVNGVARNMVGTAFKKWKNVQAAGIQTTYMEEATNMQTHI